MSLRKLALYYTFKIYSMDIIDKLGQESGFLILCAI